MLFGIFANVGGLALFLPETLNQLSKSNKSNQLLCDVLLSRNTQQLNESHIEMPCDDTVDTSSLIDLSYIGFAYFTGFAVLSSLMKKVGRQKISSE